MALLRRTRTFKVWLVDRAEIGRAYYKSAALPAVGETILMRKMKLDAKAPGGRRGLSLCPSGSPESAPDSSQSPPTSAVASRGVSLRPLPLPRPRLLRSGTLPRGDGWSFELKYDGFRAIVATEHDLHVRSRRASNMSDRVPELREFPSSLDDKPVAFQRGQRTPLAARGRTGAARERRDPGHVRRVRPAPGRRSRCDVQPVSQRRALLEGIWQGWDALVWRTCSTTAWCSSTRSWNTGWRDRREAPPRDLPVGPTGGASRRSS
jgi:hypothetical protein